MNKKNKSNWLNDQVYICIVEFFFFLHKMLKEKKKLSRDENGCPTKL